MKAPTLTLNAVKDKLAQLKGKNLNMEVCRGRKKIFKYQGTIENTFNSIFVFKLTEKECNQSTLSYSYNDVLCGDVKIDLEKEEGA